MFHSSTQQLFTPVSSSLPFEIYRILILEYYCCWGLQPGLDSQWMLMMAGLTMGVLCSGCSQTQVPNRGPSATVFQGHKDSKVRVWAARWGCGQPGWGAALPTREHVVRPECFFSIVEGPAGFLGVYCFHIFPQGQGEQMMRHLPTRAMF